MSPPEYSPVESPDASTVLEYHDLTPPSTADVYRARAHIRDYVPHSPLVRSEWLSAVYDAEVYLKREDTLPTGSFKIRGATALLSGLAPEFRDRGVVTASTGNFGRAIARAARWFDTDALVAVPEGTGANQIAGMEQLGAEVEVVGDDYDESREWAESRAIEAGYRYVHPGNERRVIAGAGTGGIEIAEDQPDVDLVLCPVGAGSVAAGYCLSVGTVTDARVVGVQSERADAVFRAWESGDLTPGGRADTFAEGIAARVPFAVPMAVLQDGLDGMFTVSEADIIESVQKLFVEERILMEGASAPPIAILEELRSDIAGQTVVVPITGRNLPMEKVRQIIDEGGRG